MCGSMTMTVPELGVAVGIFARENGVSSKGQTKIFNVWWRAFSHNDFYPLTSNIC